MNSPFRHPLRFLIPIAIAMEGSLLALHFARRDDQQILILLGAYLVCGLGWGWLLYRGWREGGRAVGNASSMDMGCGAYSTDMVGGTHPTIAMIAAIFVIGLVFRATLMPVDSTASQDVRRYLWEGLVQQAGYSPYQYAPDDPTLLPLAEQHAALHERINHRDLPAIYPAFAQLLFRSNAVLFGGTLLGWKLILLAFDLLLTGTVYVFLRKNKANAYLGLIGVWWCPLLLLETYEGGHLDLIGAALLTLAVVSMMRGRVLAAGIALGLAVNVKYLWPIMVGVLLLQAAGTWRLRAWFAAVAGVTAAACWLPYARSLPAAIETARHFAEHWTFNDPIFEIIRHIPGPQWLPMGLVLGGLCGLAAWLHHKSRGKSLWQDAWLLNGTALLLGPVAYPWYYLWVVPGLALRPPAWLLTWIILVPALHVVDWQYVRSGTWDAMMWLWIVVDAVPAVLLICAWWQKLKQDAGRATQ